MKDDAPPEGGASSFIPHPSSFDSVRLFAQCAQRRQPGFALAEQAPYVVHVCQLVEGVPLGIELAAAWVRDFSCAQIAQEIQNSLDFLQSPLRDAPTEHRSLRAVFDRSWRLLSDEEKRAFRNVAVLRGGFDADAAGGILNSEFVIQNSTRAITNYESHRDASQLQITNSLSALVDKSLLRRDPSGRYDMHELVRQYAEEKLRQAGDEAHVRAQHLNYFLAFAERAKPEMRGAKQAVWLERVEAEHGNIRAALRWSVESADAESGLKLAEAMWRFWMLRGHSHEGRQWLETLLREGSGASPTVRSDALHAVGNLARSQGDHRQAVEYLTQGLAVKRAQGDKPGIAALLGNLGNTVMELGDLKQARELQQECLDLQRELGDKWRVATALNNLGVVTGRQGDYPQAQQFYAEGLRRLRELEDKTGIAIALANLGNLVYSQGNIPQARAFLQESLVIFRELGIKRQIVVVVADLGVCALVSGDLKEGRALLEESVALARQQGDKSLLALGLSHLGDITMAEGDAKRAADLYAESLTLARQAQDQARTAQALVGLAQVADHRGDVERAIRLFGAAEALRAAVGFVLPLPERKACDESVAVARARLDAETFERAWHTGKAMPLEQAIADASERC